MSEKSPEFRAELEKELEKAEQKKDFDVTEESETQPPETEKEIPEGWITISKLGSQVGRGRIWIENALKPYRTSNPEWFGLYKNKGRKAAEFISSELKDIVFQLSEKLAPAPQNWVTKSFIRKKYGIDDRTIKKFIVKYRDSSPEWFQVYDDSVGKGTEHISPELVRLFEKEIEDYELAREGWITRGELEKMTGRTHSFIKSMVDSYRSEHPEWLKVMRHPKHKLFEYLCPELIERILTDIGNFPAPPEKWVTRHALSKQIGVTDAKIEKLAADFRDSNPEWFKKYYTPTGFLEHFSPELQEVISNSITVPSESRPADGTLETQRNNFEEFIKDIEKGRALEEEEFRKLIGVFGSSRVVDILYRFHPEYKGLQVEYIKTMLAEYLGDFLLVRQQFNLEDLEKSVEYLGDPNLRDSLYEVIKDHCLQFYHQQKKADPSLTDEEIAGEYIASIRGKTASFSNENLNQIISDVETYYSSLSEIEKPGQVIDFLEEGREFPDLNQRINIKEIKAKKRMLIADEMGLGKSASVILTKEALGLKQALVVAPSNVIRVWKDYLSDKKSEGGEKIGYFKEGRAPKVLTVESLNDLEDKDLSGFDYVLVSQERLTSRYFAELKKIDCDMLIIDEVHKLKNLKEGRRANNIIGLAEGIKGDNKYLAMLSGTPVPNKVEDVAIILKLLYPERFEKLDNNVLVQSLIRGDIVDLRNLLVQRMQMKSLESSVEMPQHREEVIETELSDLEKDVYEVLLEEDELNPTEKIQIMRKFLLNPELLDATPGIESTKIEEFNRRLQQEFADKDKVVCFVNDYIENVIRGPKAIFSKLDLPEGVEILTIEGEISKKRREEIQKELNQSDKKILLLVSGQTADVGVDFTGGETVYFYNEPWSKYDERQQLARVYRPGLKRDLESRVFVTKDTIEEGMRQYIEAKQRGIEKLLRGIPLTDLEKRLLEESEKQRDPNLEVNPELAQYYFTAWGRMMKIFSEIKEIGEEDFRKYLARFGREYADCYLELGPRSYQANASRVASTAIQNLIAERGERTKNLRIHILDIASGPEVLRKHISDEAKEKVFSIDVNKHHFAKPGGKKIVGSFGQLPIKDKSIDYANLSLALHYTKFIPSKKVYERVEVMKEINRVLTDKGRVVINLIYSLDLKNEDMFRKSIGVLGFKVVDEASGEVIVGQSYKSRIITLEKVRDISEDLTELIASMDKGALDGFKFRRTKSTLKDTRRILENFDLAGKTLKIELNREDREIAKEEKELIQEGEALKSEYGKIEEIPRKVVIEHGFVRFFDGKKYVLFKKLTENRGVVVIK